MSLPCIEVKTVWGKHVFLHYTRSCMSASCATGHVTAVLKGTEYFRNLQMFNAISISQHALFCGIPAWKSLHRAVCPKHKHLAHLQMNATVWWSRTLHRSIVVAYFPFLAGSHNPLHDNSRAGHLAQCDCFGVFCILANGQIIIPK